MGGVSKGPLGRLGDMQGISWTRRSSPQGLKPPHFEPLLNSLKAVLFKETSS
jgi:hypothetical protein